MIHATAEVRSYWGDWTGLKAELRAFRTKRAGAVVIRYRWHSDGSAQELHGAFLTVAMALAAAHRSPIMRDVEAA